MIVTIDGPAGSGKSTVARKLANKLGFIHLNSGALFRAVALKAEQMSLALDDDDAVSALAAETEFVFELVDPQGSKSGRETRLLVDGDDISERIRTDCAGKLASRIGVLPKLREVLLWVQRNAAERCSVVLEGRDAGTVVFPNAEAKFYLDAALETRAKRRFQDLTHLDQKGELDIETVLRDMQARDQREMTREVAPLRPAEDALLIDSSDMSIDEVIVQMCEVIISRESRE